MLARVGDLEEGAAGEGQLVLAVDAAGVVGLLVLVQGGLQLQLRHAVVAHVQVRRGVAVKRRRRVAVQGGEEQGEEVGVRYQHHLPARAQLLVQGRRPQPGGDLSRPLDRVRRGLPRRGE